MCLLPTPMLLLILSMLAGCTSTPSRPASGAFVEREVRVDGALHRYQVFVPARSATAAKPPVILFLHGSGERGDDNRKQAAVGLGRTCAGTWRISPRSWCSRRAPRAASGATTPNCRWPRSTRPSLSFHGDPARVYLTGMSMGGYGTWDLAVRQPGLFAALVPICAASPHRATAGRRCASPPSTARRIRSPPSLRRSRIFPYGCSMAPDDLASRNSRGRWKPRSKAAGVCATRATPSSPTPTTPGSAYSQTPALWEWLFAQRR